MGSVPNPVAVVVMMTAVSQWSEACSWALGQRSAGLAAGGLAAAVLTVVLF